ncbi:MAG: hypothetical protein HGB20_05670 [Chlorobiaceae bacterium]|nr:hypothetical protein [Chlorobiaceae bacterium]
MKQETRFLAIEARLCLVLSVIFIHGKVITPGLCHYGFIWSYKFEHLFAFFILSLLLDFAFPG